MWIACAALCGACATAAQDAAQEPPQRATSVHPVSGAGPQTAARLQAPAALPTLGDAKELDAFGYPRAYVDRVALQTLLRDRKYADLTRAFEDAQAAFERDWHAEYWVHDAVEAFPSDPALEPLFAEWVAASPTSFAPLAARGAWLCDRGLEARGGKLARNTSDEAFAAMHALHARGTADLFAAIQMRPKLVAAMRVLIVMGTRGVQGVPEPAVVMRDATKACPECLHWRVAYMISLEPRWGGSLQEMEAFAHTSVQQGAHNTRLAVLAGYPLLDRADAAADTTQRLGFLEQALQAGEAADFYRERAKVRSGFRNTAGAIDDMRRAVALRPAVATNHAELALRLAQGKRYTGALASIDTATRLDAASRDVASYRASVHNIVHREELRFAASREALEAALSITEDAARRTYLERRLHGRTLSVPAVDDPPAWNGAVPARAELVQLLDDTAQRDAAFCHLLDDVPEPFGSTVLDGVRCEVTHVERARAVDGSDVHVVFAASWLPRATAQTGTAKGAFHIFDADGHIVNAFAGENVLDDFGGVVTLMGERKAFVMRIQYASGKHDTNDVIHVIPIDRTLQPALKVAVGPPHPRPRERALVQPAPTLMWRMRDVNADGARDLELFAPSAPKRVVATYRTNKKTLALAGPAGKSADGFLKLDAAQGCCRDLALDAWSKEIASPASTGDEPQTP